VILTAVDYPLGGSAEVGYLNASGIGVSGIITDIWYRIHRESDSQVMQDWSQATIDTEVDGLYTASPFSLNSSWNDELYIIEYYSIDNLGHTESSKFTTINLDNTEPSKILNYDVPKYRTSAIDLWNISSATDITLTVDDGTGSGVNKTEYRVWGPGFDTGWVSYTTAFTITSSWNDGFYTLEYNCTDNLGNEDTQFDDFYLDNNGPDSYITGQPWILKYPNRYEINSSTIFTMTGDDGPGSGVQYIEYRLFSDTTWNTYTSGMNYTALFASLTEDQKTGNQTIVVRSVDNLDNVGPETLLLIYMEEDTAPPTPPVLRAYIRGSDIYLEWEYLTDKPDDIAYYKIYESNDINGFTFDSLLVNTNTGNDGGVMPLRNSWNHTGAAADDPNHYYVITAVDTKQNEGYTSNIVGKVTLTFTEGYNTFGLPLKPFEDTTASQMLQDDKFTDDRDTIYRYDTDSQNWIGRPKDMPSSMDDFTLNFGEGYMIYIIETEVKYSITGSAGTAIRFMKDVVGEDQGFRNSLSITHETGNLQLSWSTVTTASGYNVYMGTNRYGTASLNDFDLDMVNINEGPVTGTTYTVSMGSETELYFLVVALDASGMEGASTYGVGVKKVAYSEGYSLISMELDPKPQAGVGSFANNMFDDESGTLFFYDKEIGNWRGHPKDLPENINNVEINTGKAYIVYVDAEDVSYVFTGV
jgi:hypothetical protein